MPIVVPPTPLSATTRASLVPVPPITETLSDSGSATSKVSLLELLLTHCTVDMPLCVNVATFVGDGTFVLMVLPPTESAIARVSAPLPVRVQRRRQSRAVVWDRESGDPAGV